MLTFFPKNFQDTKIETSIRKPKQVSEKIITKITKE